MRNKEASSDAQALLDAARSKRPRAPEAGEAVTAFWRRLHAPLGRLDPALGRAIVGAARREASTHWLCLAVDVPAIILIPLAIAMLGWHWATLPVFFVPGMLARLLLTRAAIARRCLEQAYAGSDS